MGMLNLYRDGQWIGQTPENGLVSGRPTRLPRPSIIREVLALLLTVSAVTLSAEPMLAQRVDLIAGTFEGAPICELTLDEFTERLGRPSAVQSLEMVSSLGPVISYHSRGVYFLFNPGERGQQTPRGFTIHLSRSRDDLHDTWYEVFTGNLHPEVSGHSTADEVVDAVGEWDLERVTPEMLEQELEGFPAEVRSQRQFQVRVSLEEHDLIFIHEPETLFLELVTLRCNEEP